MTVTLDPKSSARKKLTPLLRRKGRIKNIGRLGITNQKIWELKIAILAASLVSNHIQVSEIMDTKGRAIMKAAKIVDLLLTSVATKMRRAEVRAFTICKIDSILSLDKFKNYNIQFKSLYV